MKYSEVKRYIRAVRAFGYGKHIGTNFYYREWRQVSNGKVFKSKHFISAYEFKFYTMDVLQHYIMRAEDRALHQLRRAVITDGLSLEEEN